MIFGRKQTSPGPRPIGEAMSGLADAFTEGLAAEGYPIAIGPGAEEIVDSYLAAFVASAPPEEVRHSVIVSGGAFVGELIRHRVPGSEWFEEEGSPALRVGTLVAYPLDKVAKRVELGPQHSIPEYVRAAADRAVLDAERRAGNARTLPSDPQR